METVDEVGAGESEGLKGGETGLGEDGANTHTPSASIAGIHNSRPTSDCELKGQDSRSHARKLRSGLYRTAFQTRGWSNQGRTLVEQKTGGHKQLRKDPTTTVPKPRTQRGAIYIFIAS